MSFPNTHFTVEKNITPELEANGYRYRFEYIGSWAPIDYAYPYDGILTRKYSAMDFFDTDDRIDAIVRINFNCILYGGSLS